VSTQEPGAWLAGEGSRRYRILSLLGEGGYGRVYRARLEGAADFSKEVAVKLLREDNPSEELLGRFRDEARLLGLIQDRAVVKVDAPVRLGGKWAVIMEYVPGESAESLLARGAFPATVALEVIREIARCLNHLSTQPGPDGEPLAVVHRDLKPANIQITPSGEVKVLDFGIARGAFAARESKTTQHIGGTPGYIAPERLLGHDTGASDVYSLGIVLHELVTGEPLAADTPGSPDTVNLDRLDVEAAPLSNGGDPILDLASAMRAVAPSDRPTAREVEVACRKLLETVDGPELAEWTQKAMELAPTLVADDLVGGVLTEEVRVVRTVSTPVPRREGWILTAALVIAIVLAVASWWSPRAAQPVEVDAPPVAPFTVGLATPWAPDGDAAAEADLILTLVERQILPLAELDAVAVANVDHLMPRTDAEAKALMADAGLQALFWGEMLVVGDDVEFIPRLSVALVRGGWAPGAVTYTREGGLASRKEIAGEVGIQVLLWSGAYVMSEDAEQGRDLLERVDPPTATSLEYRALAETEMDNPDAALRLLRLSTRLFPDEPDVWLALCRFHEAQGDPELATPACERAAEVEENSENLLTNAWAQCSVGEWAKAQATFERAIDLEPGRGEAYVGLGWAQLAQGQYSDAEETLHEALAVRDSPFAQAYAHHHLGCIDDFQGDFAAAVAHYRASIAVSPMSTTRLALYQAQYRSGREEDARRDLAKWLDADAAGIEASMGGHLLGRIDGEELMSQAVDPHEETRARFIAGLVHVNSGDADAGRALLQQVRPTSMTSFVEYHRATVELSRLK